MPTISAHVSDEIALAVTKAAPFSEQKKPGPYIAEAVRIRLERDGMLPGDAQAEIVAISVDLGPDRALAALRREARKTKAAVKDAT